VYAVMQVDGWSSHRYNNTGDYNTSLKLQIASTVTLFTGTIATRCVVMFSWERATVQDGYTW